MNLIEKAINLGFKPKNKDYYLWELQKWLRNKHFINCRVASNSRKSHFPMTELLDLDGTTGANPRYHYNYKTYEEALEAGLLEALELL
jgi:hypothetical protein